MTANTPRRQLVEAILWMTAPRGGWLEDDALAAARERYPGLPESHHKLLAEIADARLVEEFGAPEEP